MDSIRNMKRKNNMKGRDVDWEQFQELHNSGMYIYELIEKFEITKSIVRTAIKNGFFIGRYMIRGKKHSKETKRKLSNIQKKWLKDNPEKHPWRRSDKFKSKPCISLKDKLKLNDISFVEEYEPLNDRFFSIDIAFPAKMIGIEVNGKQHYNSDGTLKEYYQNRHNLIIESGWELIELYYSVVYVDEIIDRLINEIKNNYQLKNDDYSHYKPNKKERKKYKCMNCSVELKHKRENNKCRKCYSFSKRKVKDRPSKEQLLKEIEETNYSAVGRKYGVSCNAVRKWIKNK